LVKYKTIRIKKKGGGTRLQRVQVLPSGKYKFVKNKLSWSTKLTKTSKKNTRRKTKVARKRKSRRSRKFTIPIAPIAGIVASPAVRSTITDAIAGNFDGALKNAGQIVGVWEGKFYFDKLVENIGPMVVGALVHKFVGGPPLNLNRMIANAGVPVIRI